MEKFKLSLLALILLALACQSPRTALRNSAVNGGQGAEENPGARKRWELERLADPQTGRIPFLIREKELAFASTLPGNSANARLSSNQVAWQQRGPYNLGGRTRAMALDVNNENIIFAGGVSGGLWRSTDGGNSWNRVSSLTGYQGLNAIVQDSRPGHTDTWYYLTGEGYGTSASGGGAFYLGNGLYKSTDGGLTWNSLASTTSGTPHTFDNVWDVTWNIALDPSNSSQEEIYVAAYDAIFRSVNGGTSWSLVKGGGGGSSLQAYFTDVAVSPAGVVYATISSDGAASQKGIWRSVDGISWTNITPAFFPAVYDRLVIEIDPNDENRVYFFGPTPGYGRVSTDYQGDTLYNSLWRFDYDSLGGVWIDLSQNMPGNIGPFNGLNTQGGYDVVVKVKPGDPNTVFIGGTNIFRSISGFTDSLNTAVIGGYEIGAALPFVGEYPGHHPDQHVFCFLPSDPDVMYSASDGGVSRTDDIMADTVVWVDKSNGYLTSQFYTVTVDMNSTGDVLMGGLQDNGTYYTNSVNPSDPWTHAFDGDGSYSAIGNGTDYFFSKQLGRIYKTTVDSAGNVTAYRRIDPIGAVDYRFIAPFVLDPNDNNIMYLCAGESIWRNDDLSAIPLTGQFDSISTNWVQFPDTLTIADEVITALAISTFPAHRLYYGTNKKSVFRIDNANTGIPARTNVTFNQFPAAGYVSCIAVNPQDADEVLVVFSNYNVYSLFHSANGGSSWTRVAGNLEATISGSGNGPSLRWASILPLSGGGKVYLIASSTGVYATSVLNGSSTVWIQQGVGSIGTSVADMVVTRPADGFVAAGTHGNGMFTTTITDVNDITALDEVNVSSSFNVFPNPAGRELNVAVTSGLLEGSARLNILDERGRLLKSMEAFLSKDNAFSVPVAGLHAGAYLLVLQKDSWTLTKPFIKR